MKKNKAIISMIIFFLECILVGCVSKQSNEEILSDTLSQNLIKSGNDVISANGDSLISSLDDIKAPDIPENMLAYWMVLNGKKPFVSYDRGGQEFFWNEFYGISVTQYMIVDMDSDGQEEVVMYAYPESAWILHYEEGAVYCYQFAYRGMLDIHTNGIYQQSEGAGNGKYCRLTEMNEDGYTIETLVEYDYYNHIYVIEGKEASEKEALELLENIRESSAFAEPINGEDTEQLLGILTSEEYSYLENIPREEIISSEASYPMDADARRAYYEVLTNQREFISTQDDNAGIYIKDYLPNGDNQPEYVSQELWRPDRIWYFSIVDMDGDGTCEIILDGTYARDILCYRNGEVYSYRLNSGIIFNNGVVCTSEYTSPEYERISSFNDYEFVMEAVNYEGDIHEDRIQYYYFSEELIEQNLGY